MSKNPQHLDSATPPYGSAQNDCILRGFLNQGFDVWGPILKCFLLFILHEGHSYLKLQDPPYVQEYSILGFCDSAFRLRAE